MSGKQGPTIFCKKCGTPINLMFQVRNIGLDVAVQFPDLDKKTQVITAQPNLKGMPKFQPRQVT